MRIFNFCVFSLAFLHGSAMAKCLSDPSFSDDCRYPKGDAWCVERSSEIPYAYSDKCLAVKNSNDTRNQGTSANTFDQRLKELEKETMDSIRDIQEMNNAEPIQFTSLLPENLTSIPNAEALSNSVKDAVSYLLKDPDSAQFRNIKFINILLNGREQIFSCGEVNSKNSYGGYAGYQLFFTSDKEVKIGRENMPNLVKLNGKWFNFTPVVNFCITKGVPLATEMTAR